MRGGTFAFFFLNTQTSLRETVRLLSTLALFLSFHQILFFNDVCSRNGKGESGTLVSAHLSVEPNMVHPSIEYLVHSQKRWNELQNTCYDMRNGFLAIRWAIAKVPTDGNVQF